MINAFFLTRNFIDMLEDIKANRIMEVRMAETKAKDFYPFHYQLFALDDKKQCQK